MNNAVYQKPDAAMPIPNYYNETVTYDKNGNISTMVRNGDNDVAAPSIVIDNLTYTYEPNTNKLLSVTDATPAATSGFRDQVTDNLSNNSNGNINDYGYDLNGNMTSDDNKEITSIKYNHLNLPVEINFTGTSRKINYLYNAAGGKLRKVVTNGGVVTTTDYLNGFQYNAAVLVFFPHAEGYVSNTVVNGNNQYRYVFNYTDHLGNVRLSYSWNTTTSSLQILEESNYYPFGLKHSMYNVTNNQPNYKYKYNGQENQDELGLNVTAMDFRQYDNAIGRFTCIDLLAESSINMTPYHFGNNNPVYWGDPSGLKARPLNSGSAWLDAIWENSSSSGWTTWLNTGDGFQLYEYIDSGGSTGGSSGMIGSFVSYDGFFFPGNGILLQEVVIINNYQAPSSTTSGGGIDFFKTTDSLLAVGGLFAGALESRATWNAGIVYNYGTRAISAGDLTSQNAARMARISRIARAAGNTLGLASVALNIAEDISKDNFGAGTIVKTAIGAASLVFPGFGLVYGFVDVMFLATTGTSLTNHIGDAVDNQFK
ncbi:RHS repeat-associated core domain-containing protein [Flavobacterium sp. j3]|uniref:RHS repeat-associated core domain-containing protein n=1 Tax=Flavobacterium aureirubrum TaxID=3133147 RepID=A0ABU9NAP3_9FLAO